MCKQRCSPPLLLLALLGLMPSPAAAQTAATISGLVTDGTGGVLPGVTVTATSLDTGGVRTDVTDEQGRYEVSNLGLGEHELRAELGGFRTAVRRGITLTVGSSAAIDFTMELGTVAEEVLVTGEAPLVQNKSSSLSSAVTSAQIQTLPMNARDLSKLLVLNPGVTHFRHQGGSDTSGYGARMSVGGARVLQNSFTLDGTEVTGYQGGTPGGATGGIMGVDTIREFNVITNAFSAQYGRAAGANVVAVTRSGTNQIHGTAVYYHRNDGLDARNFFDGVESPELRRHQYGASVGGPIIRDRTFVFGSFERLNERLGRTESELVPTAAAREGILPSGIVQVDPKVKPYLALWPLPNGPELGGGAALYTGTTNQPTTQNYFSVRVDHRLSNNHSFFGRYLFDESDRVTPSLTRLVHTVTDVRNQYFTMEYSGVFSSNLVSRVRFGLNRSRDDNGGDPDSLPRNELPGGSTVDLYDPKLVFLTGQPIGIIDVTGLGGTGAVESFRSQMLNSYQFNYDLDYVHGSHSLKAGGTFIRDVFDRTADTFVAGSWEFGSFQNFLQNRPGNFRIQGPGEPTRTMLQNSFGFYLQDDWTMRPRLTLNLGMRYEFQTVPTEKEGRITNLRHPFATERTVGDPLWDNPSLKNFSPRLGFAWDLFGDGRTSLRGGAGLFWETLGVKIASTQIFSGPPFSIDINPLPSQLPGLFPNVDAVFDQLAAGAVVSHAVDPYLKNPRTGKWMLSLQRELWRQTVVTVAYTGSIGAHLISRVEYTRPQAIRLDDGRWFYPAAAPIINPTWARNEWYFTQSSSDYHAMQLGLQRRSSAGLRVGVAYTFSKSIDTSSAHWAGEAGDTRIMSPWDISLDRGLSNFDVRHNIIVDFGYDVPFGAGLTGAPGALLKGWRLAGIVQAMSGFPLTVTSDRRLTHPLIFAGGRPNLVAGASNNPVLGGPDQYFDVSAFAPQDRGFYGTLGRNTLIGPGLFTVDLSLLKSFAVRGRHAVQFRMEVFNALNRVNFSQPDRNVFNQRGSPVAGAGRISSTSTTARQIQVALRYEF